MSDSAHKVPKYLLGDDPCLTCTNKYLRREGPARPMTTSVLPNTRVTQQVHSKYRYRYRRSRMLDLVRQPSYGAAQSERMYKLPGAELSAELQAHRRGTQPTRALSSQSGKQSLVPTVISVEHRIRIGKRTSRRIFSLWVKRSSISQISIDISCSIHRWTRGTLA